MRNKRLYLNGQSRGGTPGSATVTTQKPGRHAKDYHRVAVGFHGGEMAFDKYVEGGRKGYAKSGR